MILFSFNNALGKIDFCIFCYYLRSNIIYYLITNNYPLLLFLYQCVIMSTNNNNQNKIFDKNLTR